MLCHHRFLLLVIIQILVLLLKLGNGQNQPDEILKFHPYKNGTTMVQFPSIPALKGVSLSVDYVDSESCILWARDPEYCFPRLFLQHQLYNSSISPLEFANSHETDNITFLNCTSVWPEDEYACPIYPVRSIHSVLVNNLFSCTVVLRIVSPVPAGDLQRKYLALRFPQTKYHAEKHKTRKMIKIVLPSTGSIMLVLMFIVCFYIYRYFKMKGDDQSRLEKFLEDYKALNPTRFSYADLKRITNNFKEKLGEGAHGSVFEGKLSTEVQVAVKVLNNSDSDGEDFVNELGTMGKIHHINVVRLLGFCADGFHRALVYDFFPNGSLQKFISSPDKKENFLGWLKLQQIVLGIAKGIEYLHQGCDYRILHFDINPRNVLLDHNFTPKISDFGLVKLCSKNQSAVSMTAVRGTLGYIAPEVFSRNFGNVSYKSDIYSYGMLLLEMVGGRKNVDTNQESIQVLYPEWIHNLIERGDINIYIEDEDDTRIAKKLAIVGLWCIQWHSINRPSMKTVIQMLEGEVDKLKVPPTPFDFTASTNTCSIIPERHLSFELEVIHEL